MGGTMVDLRRDLAEVKSILRAREGELRRMKQALEEFRGRRTTKSPARQSSPLKAKLESLQKELAEEKQLKEQAQQELVKVKAMCDHAIEENAVLKEQVSDLRQELQASETTLVKTFITVTEKDAEIDDLKRELVESSSAQVDGEDGGWRLKITQGEVLCESQDGLRSVDSGEPNQPRNPAMPSEQIMQQMLAALLHDNDEEYPEDAFECNVQKEIQDKFRAAFEHAFTTAFESAFDAGSDSEPGDDDIQSEAYDYNSDAENEEVESCMNLHDKLQLLLRFPEEGGS